MGNFENSLTVHRPAAEVFAYLADLENVPSWNYAIVETAKVTEGPPRVGSVYRQVRSIPSRSEERLEITAFEPDRLLRIRGQLGPFDAVLTYELEDADGGTRLTNRVDLRGRGVLGPLSGLATPQVRTAVAANLDKLKEILESAPRQSM